MLDILLVIIALMWLAGMLTKVTLGGLLHLLIILFLAVLVYRVLTGRRPL